MTDAGLAAFHEKMRAETRAAAALTDEPAFAARNQLGLEIADILRRNVVQGVRVDDTSRSAAVNTKAGDEQDEEKAVWRMSFFLASVTSTANQKFSIGLRLTEHTELGSNESIRQMASGASCSSRPAPRETQDQAPSSA